MAFGRHARTIFVAYALVLFVTTHWPRLRIEPVGGFTRMDLIIHTTAFGIWALLLCRSGLVGRAVVAGSWAVGIRAWVVGALYAAFDEGTQAIPMLGRTAAWDDFAADLLGITLGTLLAGLTLPRPGIAAHSGPA